MSDIMRFSVPLESDLFERFDKFCEMKKFVTRSEAVRQLIREKLTAQTATASGAEVAASLTLVYDHHKPHLNDRKLDVQHAHARLVVSSMHVHLNHDLCMEVIILRGLAKKLHALAAELSGMKGVHQAQLVIISATDESAGDSHDHSDHHSARGRLAEQSDTHSAELIEKGTKSRNP